jgi:hypothetical protein
MTRIFSRYDGQAAWIPEAWTRFTFDGYIFRRAANGFSLEYLRHEEWVPVLDRAPAFEVVRGDHA